MSIILGLMMAAIILCVAYAFVEYRRGEKLDRLLFELLYNDAIREDEKRAKDIDMEKVNIQ